MAGEIYTARDYSRLFAFHLLVSFLLSVAFVLGMHFSGSERGTVKTPYFFTSMVLAGFNLLSAICCLYVIINTRNSEVFVKKTAGINKALAWYNLIVNIGMLWCIIGLILTLTLGACKGDKCYAQTHQNINIVIAVSIAVFHFICFWWFVRLGSKVRALHYLPSKTTAKPSPPKRIHLESDSSDSDDDKKKSTDNKISIVINPVTPQGNNKEKATEVKNRLPFAVVSKTIVLFMLSKKKAKEVAPQEPHVATVFKQDRGHPYIQTDLNEDTTNKGYRRSQSGPVGLPPPPSYDAATAHTDNKRTVPNGEIQYNTPYNIPPLPEETGHRPHPDSLYTASNYPDTFIPVALPKKGNKSLKSRHSTLK